MLRPACLSVALLVLPLAPLFAAAADIPDFTEDDEALVAGRYEKAATGMEKRAVSLKAAPGAPEAWIRAARAWILAGKPEKAVSALTRFEAGFPASSLRFKARYLKSTALAAGGDFAGACAILESELSRLDSPETRSAVSRLLLAQARSEFHDGQAGGQDDPVENAIRALALLQAAKDYAGGDRELEIEYCMAALAANETDRAARAARWLVRAEPPLGISEAVPLARALLAAGVAHTAGDLVDRAIAPLKPQDVPVEALEVLANSLSRRADSDPNAAARAVETWTRILDRGAFSPVAGRAALGLISTLSASGESDVCAAACDRVASLFPGDDVAAQAAHAKAAALLSAGRSAESIAAFRSFLGAWPDHALSVKAMASLRNASMAIAQEHFSARRFAEAAAAFRSFADSFPLSPEAPSAALKAAECAIESGDSLAAVRAYQDAAGKYETVAPAALLAAAEVMEKIPGAARAAAASYAAVVTRFPKSEEARRAAAHKSTLESPGMEIRVPGVFPTSVAPHVELVCRNVESVRFRVYRLDMEEVFYAGGFDFVGALVLDVVKPDFEFMQAVLDPAQCETRRSEVRLPVSGPGSFAVVAEAGDLHARALVIVSDLSMVIKTAPGQALVFVRDEVKGQGVAGARVLLSINGRHLDEVKTGDRGAVMTAVPLRADSPSDVMAMAVSGGHIALARLEKYSGSSNKGGRAAYVYTDRSLYRPGETVSFRGVFRTGNGSGATPVGKDALIKVEDPSNRMVLQKKLECSAFGTVSGEFALADTARAGKWRIQGEVGGETYTGTFEVKHYRTPGFFLEADTGKPWVIENNDVKVSLSAKSLGGFPIGGLKVRVEALRCKSHVTAMPAGELRARELRFDDAKPVAAAIVELDGLGRGSFSFKADGATASPLLLIRALAEDSTGAIVVDNVLVAVGRAAFAASIEPDSDAFAPDVAAGATLFTSSPAGDPVPGSGELVFESAGAGGGFAQKWRRSVSTGPGGKLPVALGRLEPGEYRLRFVGRDESGRIVTAKAACKCAAGQGRLPYQVVLASDRDSYAEGDVARVRASAADLRGEGLLTVEAENIVDWMVVLFGKDPEIAVPVRGESAPNAFFRVAVPSRGGALEGECAFAATRKIDVSVTPRESSYRPGSEAALDIRTLDTAGRPAPCEVSVSVIDSTVLELEPDPTPEIYRHFFGFTRFLKTGTASSCGFKWSQTATPMDPEFLSERTRIATETERDSKDVTLLKEKALDPVSGSIGIGGGAGATFGGRFGGRRNLRAHGGGGGGRAGLNLGPRERKLFEPSAFWSATVVTDPRGAATVRFKLPDNLTKWVVIARAVGEQSRFGETRASFDATKPLTVELDVPGHVVEGDRFAALARVRASGAEPAVKVSISSAGLTAPAEGIVSAGGGETGSLLAMFDASTGAQKAAISASAAGAAGSDAETRQVRILPGGYRISKPFGGMAAGRASHSVMIPTNRRKGGTLRVRVDPGVRSCIADSLRTLEEYPYGCIEQTINRFVPAAAALEALQKLGIDDNELKTRFARMSRAGLERLADLQSKDGSFSWFGTMGDGDACMTSYAYIAMAVSLKAGVDVELARIDAAAKFLKEIVKSQNESPDSKAFALFALSFSGPVDEDLVFRALALRDRLEPSGLAFLSIAMSVSGKPVLAREIAAQASARQKEPTARKAGRSSDESAAFVLLAMLRSSVEGAQVEAAARKLVESRGPGGWSHTRATGAAVMALSAYMALKSEGLWKGEIKILLNGRERGLLQPGQGEQACSLLIEGLDDGENVAELVCDSGSTMIYAGEFAWHSDIAPETPPDGLQVRRDWAVLPPAPVGELDTILAAPAFEPQAGPVQAAVGDRILVRISVKPSGDAEYVLVEDPVPGCVQILGPAKGSACDSFEDRGTHAAVFFSRIPAGGTMFEYYLRVTHPGSYQAGGTRVEPMYSPEKTVSGKASSLLALEKSQRSESPDARYARALAAAADGRHGEALVAFAELLSGPSLKERAVTEITSAMLESALESGADAAAVKAFSSLTERGAINADDTGTLIRVASAHLRSGDGDRAMEIFGAAARSAVRGLVGVSEVMGEPGQLKIGALLGVDRLSSLLPDGPELEESAFATAIAAAKKAADDNRGGAGATSARIAGSAAALFGFALDHPGSKRAEEAWIAGVRALRDAKEWAVCSREAGRHLRLFGGGTLVDEALWCRAYSNFAAGKLDEALADATRLMDERFRQPDGSTRQSGFLHNAQHLAGQIHEIRGDPDKAEEFYEMASGFISDAANALSQMSETVIAAGGFVTVRPSVKARIPVEFRNVGEITVKAYPVDLRLFFTLSKGLGKSDRLLLNGVTPAASFRWKFKAAPDKRRHREEIELPALGMGAYLVRLTAGPVESSVIIVVTDLDIFAQRVGGGVRVEVRDAAGKPVWGARVVVAGGASIVSSGYTDPRGFFATTDPHGAFGESERDVVESERDIEEYDDGSIWILAAHGDRYALAKVK